VQSGSLIRRNTEYEVCLYIFLRLYPQAHDTHRSIEGNGHGSPPAPTVTVPAPAAAVAVAAPGLTVAVPPAVEEGEEEVPPGFPRPARDPDVEEEEDDNEDDYEDHYDASVKEVDEADDLIVELLEDITMGKDKLIIPSRAIAYEVEGDWFVRVRVQLLSGTTMQDLNMTVSSWVASLTSSTSTLRFG
jgi:hypothetical protein